MRARLFCTLFTVLSSAALGPQPAAHDGEITDPVERIELAISDRRLTVYRG